MHNKYYVISACEVIKSLKRLQKIITFKTN